MNGANLHVTGDDMAMVKWQRQFSVLWLLKRDAELAAGFFMHAGEGRAVKSLSVCECMGAVTNDQLSNSSLETLCKVEKWMIGVCDTSI